jgi:hypothetical protein
LRDEALGRARLDHLIDEWDDRDIRGGQNWEDEIIDRARKSQVFLLIVTNRFLGSAFIRYTELTIARALLAKRAAAVLPIVVEDADWQMKNSRTSRLSCQMASPSAAKIVLPPGRGSV